MRWPPWRTGSEDEYERQHAEDPADRRKDDDRRAKRTAEAFERLEEVTSRLEVISHRLESRLEGTPPVPPATPVGEGLREEDLKEGVDD